MIEFRKSYWFKIVLCTSCLSLLQVLHAYSADGEDLSVAVMSPEEATARVEKDVYTINFNNVSIIEFVRFASKLTGLNFIFDDADLQFNVTVVSEEPVSAKNVMSALAQVLRMHDLVLLEQESNVLLTKSDKVRQIPTIVSSDLPDARSGNAVLVTRVFRIKNANANTIAGIIRPLTSDSALIEVSNETRQLIVTDITTNVDKIADLLLSIDSPHSPLEIETYVVKNVPPADLIALTQLIVAPFAEGNPLFYVPQPETHSIFIVSTPFLIERSLTVMEDLDKPPKPTGYGPMAKKNVFIYKILNNTPDELIEELKLIAQQLKERGSAQPALQQTIERVEIAEDTNSLIFLADDDTVNTLKTLLSSLDIPPTNKPIFYIYKIQQAKESQIASSLEQMKDRLQSVPHPDLELVQAIGSMSWNKETNALIFTGTPAAVQKLKDILPTFDVVQPQVQAKSTFLVYNPQYHPGDALYLYMKDTAGQLRKSGLANQQFLLTIESMQWTPTSNSLIFTGDPQSLQRIQAMLVAMDAPSPLSKASEIFVYKPQYTSPEQIKTGFSGLVHSLQSSNIPADQSLIKTIQAMEWNEQIQSFVVTADPATIERLKTLMADLDNPQQGAGKFSQGFYLYKLESARGDLVIQELKQISSKFPPSNPQNQSVAKAINSIEWVKSNNSLLITGSPEIIDRIKTLVAEFDLPSATATGAQAFFIYKPQFVPAEEVKVILADLTADLQAAGLVDPQLLQTLSTVRYVEATNSLLFTGSQATLDKVKGLLTTIDNSQALSAIQKIGNVTFFLYKLQHASADQFMASLRSFASELQKSNVEDRQVADAIQGMKWVKENNSILFTGTPQALQRIEELSQKFDLGPGPSAAHATRTVTDFVIYNPKYLPGEDLITVLCEFMDHLIRAGVSDPTFFDTITNIQWMSETCSLIVSGDKESLERVQALLTRFDVPSTATGPSIESIENTSFLVYKLQYHTGVDIQAALKQVALNLTKGTSPNVGLAEAIESLQWIQPTNSLLATGQSETLVKLKDLIQNLDVPLRQVFIEILVLQTNLTNTQNFGLQWGGQFQYFNKTIAQTGNFPTTQTNGSAIPPGISVPLQGINATTTPNNTSIPFNTGFDLGVIGDIIMHKGKSFISLGSLVNAIQLDSDSTIIINQKIITQDNRQSTIFVGNNVPYTGAIVTNTQSNTTTTANIEYRDVGVQLTITPMLGENDIVTLDIVQDLSQVTNSQNSATSTTVLTGIQTSHTHMETRVHVPNSKFVALSGMILDSKTHFRTGIPCLGSLPVVGILFSENDRTNTKANVIIFVRPVIIDTIEEYKQVTERQEWLYKDQARLPVLKEEFEEGLDTVKMPEDE